MLFKVIKAPDGSSPQWVRDAWVGVRFQALQGAPVSMQTRAAGSAAQGLMARARPAQDAKAVTERHGYPTKARDVLGLLALQSPDAARWYIDNAAQMLDPEQIFLFDATCCAAISDLS